MRRSLPMEEFELLANLGGVWGYEREAFQLWAVDLMEPDAIAQAISARENRRVSEEQVEDWLDAAEEGVRRGVEQMPSPRAQVVDAVRNPHRKGTPSEHAPLRSPVFSPYDNWQGDLIYEFLKSLAESTGGRRWRKRAGRA